MSFQCQLDETFSDYRERIEVRMKDVKCSESRVTIPAGTPIAICKGFYDGKWEVYPQAIKVWRFLRNHKRNHGSCFCFEGVDEEMYNAGPDDNSDRCFIACWESLKKRLKARYAEGKGPRLNKYERASLASGEWADWVCWHDGNEPAFNSKERGLHFAQPNTDYGCRWIQGESDDKDEDGGG